MPFIGPYAAWQCPAAVQPVVTGTVYRGACKFVGYNALAGKAAGAGIGGAGLGGAGLGTKGLCLGLGLGLGAWGPLALVGVAIIGGYFLLKDDRADFEFDPEETIAGFVKRFHLAEAG
jgi:hypothetical protein